MNRLEYINKLKDTQSRLDALILLESIVDNDELSAQDNEIGNKFLSKTEQDYNNIKSVEEQIKAKIGASVYNKAVNIGLKALKKKIMAIEIDAKKASEDLDNKDKLFYYMERGSDIIYQCLEATVGSIYLLFTHRELKDETPETFSSFTLTLCPTICNSIASILLMQYFGFMKGLKLLTVLVAPLTEEYCKQVALRIGGATTGLKYTAVFSGIEAADYVLRLYKYVGPRIFLYRFVAIMLHFTTTLVQHAVTEVTEKKLKSFAFLVGVMIHSLYNANGNKLVNFLDKVFPPKQ